MDDENKMVQFKEDFSGTKIVSFVQTYVINVSGYLNSVLTDQRAFINMLDWECNRTRQEETNIIQQPD